jgi:hypothetical protein
VQSGTDTLLQIDQNGSAPGYDFHTLITFQNTNTSSLTAQNLGGYPPGTDPPNVTSVTDPVTGSTTTTYVDVGFAPWSHQVIMSNSDGHVQAMRVTYDDGSMQGATFDGNSNQAWISQNSVSNTQGQLTNMGVIYDDGTQQAAIFDAKGDQPWTSQNMVYDAQGRVTIMGVIYDDGHTETAIFDANDDQPWRSQSAVYDSDGTVIAMSVSYDDGQVTNWHI